MFRAPEVLIYQDYVHNNGILHRRLCETFGKDHVRFCDAGEILDGILTSDIYLLVMPGGADLYYCEKLDGAGNTAIRSYVHSGGKYLGICAGAYYAARTLNWNDGEISGPRELCFYDGVATGPIREYIEDGDIGKSWQDVVEIEIDDAVYQSFYEAGPWFNGPGIARYANQRTAIVKNRIGSGTVILSGPHIEYTPADVARRRYAHNNYSPARSAGLIEKFAAPQNGRCDIWSRVMQEFDI